MVQATAVPADFFEDASTRSSYISLSLLGKGGFAHCYKVKRAATGDLFALKVINKEKFEEKQYHKIIREIRIHKSLVHPNIVALNSSFEDKSNVYMVMELCSDRTLLARIDETSCGLSETESRCYLRGIISAVQYILSHNIIHRDIKPGNVLLSEHAVRPIVKLADFGLACSISDISPVSISGTPNYLAPEVLARKGHSSLSEAWSIGCLLYCMLVGRPPFDTKSLGETYARIARADYSYPTYCALSESAKKLIDGLLMSDVKRRTTIEEAASSFFLNPERERAERVFSAPPSPCRRSRSQLLAASSHANLNGSSYGLDTSRSGCDSGIFPESPSPQSCLQELELHALAIYDVLDGRLGLSPSSTTPVHVSKWVDYTNKYGFGCLLSDGTVTVKFNHGDVIAISRLEQEVMWRAGSPYCVPLPKDDESLGRLAQIARSYRQYMDTQLAVAAQDGNEREEEEEKEEGDPLSLAQAVPHIIHYAKMSDCIVVVLNNGTAQINFTEAHIKLIFWHDSSAQCRVLSVISGGSLSSFSLCTSSSKPSAQFSQLLRVSQDRLQQQLLALRRLRPPRTTEC